MADAGPLDHSEAPTPAARLVIVLLPDGSEQPACGVSGGGSRIAAVPWLRIPSVPREATDPEFATYYLAEMPALISFLIKCGANPGDAPEAAQEAFRELLKQWKTVYRPKLWLRQTAFPIFLRRPVSNAASPEEEDGKPASPSASSRFDFSAEERIFIDKTRLMSTAQRAVLALHSEGFPARDIAEILGMKLTTVRKNLKRARTTLKALLNSNGNHRNHHAPSVGGGPGHESQ